MMNKYIIILLISIIYCDENTFRGDFVAAALDRTNYDIIYDGRYFNIDYPNGDIPQNLGVCTDVIIRTYRAIEIDLQKLIHEDIVENFDDYPSRRIWGLTRPDSNIDHRRVPNLQTFFARYGKKLPISNNPDDYYSGDIVTWFLNGKKGTIPHIGIVVNNSDNDIPMIVHNIGYGVVLEDILFETEYKITGHYKYIPEKYQ